MKFMKVSMIGQVSFVY